MPFILAKDNVWTKLSIEGGALYVAAHESMALVIKSMLDANLSEDGVRHALKTLEGFYSFVYEDSHRLIAAVDHIRSYPVFYFEDNFSNSPYALQDKFGLEGADDESAAEFVLSGYVTGSYTLLDDVKTLQPGETVYLHKDRDGEKPRLSQYYRYLPQSRNSKSYDDKITALGRNLDQITLDIIDRAAGRPIYVPLSAGLDSRIILCKLHEHGCSNVQTFTYGPKYNFEAKYAKKIAKKLGYSWKQIIPSNKWIRACFKSEARKKFWEYACAFKSIPSMREYSALLYMHENGMIEDDAIFINGQTGDFISGGHIPKSLLDDNATMDDLYDAIVAKHYSLWPKIKNDEMLAVVKKRISEMVSGLNTNTLWSCYETWEYEGRQVVLVINGQRIYEYLGYKWEMPLWDKALVDFFEGLPVEDKFGQKLYKDYLKRYNYMGLFPDREPNLWRWPANMLWVLMVAKIVGFVRGKRTKGEFYSYMKYYGHYSNQYSFIDPKVHKATYKDTRSVMSLYVRRWIEENPQFFTEYIKAKVGLTL